MMVQLSMLDNQTMILRGDGRVGIGTTSPITKLDIRRSGGARLRLENSAGSYAGQNQAIEFCTTYATTGFLHQKGEDLRIGVTGSISNIKFYTDNDSGYPDPDGNTLTQSLFNETYTSSNDNPRMVIANNGNVGIGKTSPDHYKLDVNGDFRTASIVTNHLNATGGQLTYNGSTNSLDYNWYFGAII